jgi:hypothetical protein
MRGEAVAIAYEISDDPSMRRIVQRGGGIEVRQIWPQP